MGTKLDIVNHLLQVTGERATSTINMSNPSVRQAVSAIDGYNVDFQNKGWWFNTNQQQKLLPTVPDGEVLLPEECVSFRVTFYQNAYNGVRAKSQFVRRGGRIYDNINNTYKLDTYIIADLVMQLDIEDLPPVAFTYLKHKAAQEYYLDDDGDVGKVDRLQQRTMEAFHSLKAEALKVENTNALDSPAAQQLLYRIGNGYSRNPVWPGGRR